MKRLLYILLISFGFSATAQNASTIQQLLDEGVTIGELLDAGITPEEFLGMEFEGGVIFEIDTLNNIGKVALNLNNSLPFQCNSGGWPYTFPEVETTEDDGMQNTINIASTCLQSLTAASHALNYVNEDGYEDWYLPTKNEITSMFDNLYPNHRTPWGSSTDVISSEIMDESYFWHVSLNYQNSTTDYGMNWEGQPRHDSRNIILVRLFNPQLASPNTNQILITENQTIQTKINEGVTLDELYGLHYEGGVIFDIDTINNIGKVALNLNNSLPFQCNSGGWPYTFPEVETTEDDGMQNTINIASTCLQSLTAASHALNYVNEDGYEDWYLPTKNEITSMFDNLYPNHRTPWGSSTDVISSEIMDESYFWHVSLNYQNSTTDYGMNWEGQPRHDSRNIILVRVVALDSPTIIEVSPALESFLETYIPPVVEDEVVSDANSFDVLNPLSYNGDFESVHYSFMNGNYTVPSGKTLIIYIISNPTGIETQRLLIDDIKHLVVACCQSNLTNDIGKPIIVGGNKTLSIQDYSSINISFHGVLVNTAFESVHIDVANSNYIVPNGKTLIVSEFCSENSVSLYADDNYFSEIIGGSALGDNNNTITYTFSGNTTISSNPPAPYFLHGILIDNSNYTYATDYELIDALNEGMDSLSTMSEVVVQENDSLTTENAILTEENEALMLIEYNYDSLQYVTEYLYSQVFDLQQELLVPNIDVDMAIGWNMIGFSCPEDKSAEDALIDIVDEILIMKDNNGSVYMPEFGFNGIGDLTPGHGYQIKVTDYILDFNICE
jgi:hypothetical protein